MGQQIKWFQTKNLKGLFGVMCTFQNMHRSIKMDDHSNFLTNNNVYPNNLNITFCILNALHFKGHTRQMPSVQMKNNSLTMLLKDQQINT